MSYRGSHRSEKKESDLASATEKKEGDKLCGGVDYSGHEVKAKASQVKNSFYKRFPILVFLFDSVI